MTDKATRAKITQTLIEMVPPFVEEYHNLYTELAAQRGLQPQTKAGLRQFIFGLVCELGLSKDSIGSQCGLVILHVSEFENAYYEVSISLSARSVAEVYKVSPTPTPEKTSLKN